MTASTISNNPCTRLSNWVAGRIVSEDRVAALAAKVERSVARGLAFGAVAYILYNIPTFITGGALVGTAFLAYDAVEQRARN